MYSGFQRFCERLLRIPPDPQPPPGDEASTRIYRAAPNYFKYLVLIWAIATGGVILIMAFLLIGPVVGTVALVREGNLWGFGVLALIFLALVLAALVRLFRLAVLRLDYEKRWYVITDRSLRVREGAVNVREMTVTFANIQNISISQGPIQRALGIADLRVDTAGGGGGSSGPHGHQTGHNLHVAWFRGIDNAPAVRELVQQRLRHWKDAGLGDHEDALPSQDRLDSAEVPDVIREIYAEAKRLADAVTRA
ncbi:MAG: PH domain-containing protein [Verrucomicrobia subdivision 3 bacterium]|nr:PH domain-containing protein [Limisphaerales bacterium]